MKLSEGVDRCLSTYLYPAGVNRPLFDTLATTITSSSTTLTTNGLATYVPQTLIEIDSEEILTKEAESSTTVDLLVRGYLETTAAAHTAGAIIWINPEYTRQSIRNALTTIIRSLYPKGLYRLVAESDITADTINAIDLDALTLEVASVNAFDGLRWYELTPERDYQVITAFDPPKLQIFSAPLQGGTLRINYKTDFLTPQSIYDADTASPPTYATVEDVDLTTDCGVPYHLAEYIPMAAAGHLLIGKEFVALAEDARQEFKTGDVPPGTKMSVGERLLREFDRQVELAKRVQRERTPSRIV